MTAVFDPLSMPHAEAREALATGAPVFLCVNPVEYHGPHLSLRQDNRLIWLVYDLYQEPTISTPVTSDVFVSDTAQRQWLYDEVDVVDEPRCRHQILLSTGEVIDLCFFQFDWFIHHSPRHALVTQAAELARA